MEYQSQNSLLVFVSSDKKSITIDKTLVQMKIPLLIEASVVKYDDGIIKHHLDLKSSVLQALLDLIRHDPFNIADPAFRKSFLKAVRMFHLRE